MSQTNLEKSTNARIDQLWIWLGLLVWLGVAAVLLNLYSGRMYSSSIDVGLHGGLVSRLMETWSLPTADENLAEMATYPRIAHLLAALVGAELNSAIDGMQKVALISLVALWSVVGVGIARLSRPASTIALGAMTIFLVVNHAWLNLELFGSELVSNYFFAQFLSQCIAVCALFIALFRENACSRSLAPYIILGASPPLLASVHLLPAVELLGTFAILLLLNSLVDENHLRSRRFVAGSIIFLVATILTVANPDFLALVRISANNGSISLKYVGSFRELLSLTVIVFGLSTGLLVTWWQSHAQRPRYDALMLKYLGAFSLSVSGLCLTQILLYSLFGSGSEYACFKYAHALQTLLVLDVILLWSLIVTRSQKSPDVGPWVLAPTALASIACVCLFSSTNSVPTAGIANAVRDARQLIRAHGGLSGTRQDLAIDIAGIGGFGNYLVSRFALGAPPLGEAYEILGARMPRDAKGINRILTSKGSGPMDRTECRIGMLGDMALNDAVCIYGELGDLNCEDTVSFTSRGVLDKASTGFSSPDGRGRWSEGPRATLTCQLTTPTPVVAILEAAGLVTETHSQRMTVSVNAEPAQTVEFNASTPARLVRIPLPQDAATELVFTFSFPDAISPQELGMSADNRKLAAILYSLRFEVDPGNR